MTTSSARRGLITGAAAGALDRALAEPQVRHRDMAVELTDRDGDSIKVAGTPLKFVGRFSCEHTYPHRLGADTADILRELLECRGMGSRASPKKGVLGCDGRK